MRKLKICNKCKEEMNISEFYKRKTTKDGLQCFCKECMEEYKKEYNKNNKEKIIKYKKEYYQNNKVKIIKQQKGYNKNNKVEIIEYHKEYNKNNKEKITEYNKEYRNLKANYEIYSPQISYAEKVKNVDGFLQVKCTYCGKYYFPTNLEVQNRIRALNGKLNSKGIECRLYCSENCKQECPVYWKQLYQVGHPKNFEDTSSREVQPELRRMVFERDGYKCIKCGSTENLHCHHVEGIRWEPLESADIDKCITVCKDCHIKIHKIPGCGYQDLQCKQKLRIE